MAIISLRSRKKVIDIALSAMLCTLALFCQLMVMNRLTILGIAASLPLVVTCVWGLVFGSPLPKMTNLELRKAQVKDVFSRQMMAGSVSGLLVGLYFAFLYNHLLPSFPIALPIVGWISGYFCLKGLSGGNLICIPMVFIMTIVSELITTAYLFVLHRPGVLEHFTMIALPEALLNAVIAPCIYFPLRHWCDLGETQRALSAE